MSSMVITPEQANVEFGILLSHIIKELTKNEAKNLELIKVMCSCLTVNAYIQVPYYSVKNKKKQLMPVVALKSY